MSSTLIAPRSTRAALSQGALTVDQLIYSGSNFALAVLGGRTLTQSDFGRFALAILAISIMVNLGKAVWHEPDLADGVSATWPPPWWLVGVAVLSTLAATALPFLGVVIAAVVVAVAQDRVRYRAFAARDVRPVVAGDSVWLGFVAAYILLAVELDSPSDILLVWTAGACLSISVIVIGSRPPLAPRSTSRVPIGQRWALLLDNMLSSGMTQIGGLVLAVFLTIDDIATLRAAIIVLGPVGIVIGALTTWIFSSLDRTKPDIANVARRSSWVAVGSLVLTGVLGVLPATIGVRILGEAWPVRTVLMLIGLSVTFQALSTPGMMLFRLTDQRRALLGLRITAFALFVTVVIGTAAFTGSVLATAGGYAAVNASFAVIVWLRLAMTKRPRRRSIAMTSMPGAANS